MLDDTGSGSDDAILDGISWAVEQGAQVISMSLGSHRDVNQQYAVPYERIAIKESGVLFVAAAGNDSRRDLNNIVPIENPAACPSFMAVAAVDSGKDIAYFSNGQRDYAQVGISAPGVGVYSSWPGGKYATLDGTSMATPHVAGVATLLLEKQQHLSRQQLQTQLKAAASKLLPDTDFGAGIVKAP